MTRGWYSRQWAVVVGDSTHSVLGQPLVRSYVRRLSGISNAYVSPWLT